MEKEPNVSQKEFDKKVKYFNEHMLAQCLIL